MIMVIIMVARLETAFLLHKLFRNSFAPHFYYTNFSRTHQYLILTTQTFSLHPSLETAFLLHNLSRCTARSRLHSYYTNLFRCTARSRLHSDYTDLSRCTALSRLHFYYVHKLVSLRATLRRAVHATLRATRATGGCSGCNK